MDRADDDLTALALLRWQMDCGIDEAVGEHPVDRFRIAPPPAAGRRSQGPPTAGPPALAPSSRKPLSDGEALAAAASTVEELRDALSGFDGCPLKTEDTRLVLGDGNPDARVLLIGEAPGAEEDRLGKPFVGPSGRLLDRMLASIGLDRTTVFISNTVFWRPPANRAPTTAEIAACQPFVTRLIEIIRPQILIALGGPAAAALLGRSEGISRLRGRWYPYETPRLGQTIDATALFHPAYLLRSPAQKRLAWRDLLAIKRKLDRR